MNSAVPGVKQQMLANVSQTVGRKPREFYKGNPWEPAVDERRLSEV